MKWFISVAAVTAVVSFAPPPSFAQGVQFEAPGVDVRVGEPRRDQWRERDERREFRREERNEERGERREWRDRDVGLPRRDRDRD